MADPRTPKEAVYDSQIAPLMRQIIGICKEHKINAFAEFGLGYDHDTDSTLFCTTSLPIDKTDEKGHEVITKVAVYARKLRTPDFAAFTIIGGKTDG